MNETGLPAYAIPVLVGIAALILMGVVLLAGRHSKSRRRRPDAFTPMPRAAGATAPEPEAATEAEDAPESKAAPEPEPASPPEPEPEAEPEPVPEPETEAEGLSRPGGSLAVTEGPDLGRVYAVGDGTTLIGRAGRRENHVELSDASVSREQARIVYEPGTDAFTFVNESEINPSEVDGTQEDVVELSDGATIRLGMTALTFTRG